MATNIGIFNGCVAGAAGGIAAGRAPFSSLDKTSIVNAVATEAEALIAATVGTISGGGSSSQAAVAEALVFAVISGRPPASTTAADYVTALSGIGLAYQRAVSNVSGIKGFQKTLSVAIPAITGVPNTSVVTVVDASFVGGHSFLANFLAQPSDGSAAIASLLAFPDTVDCPNGAVDIAVTAVVGNTAGGANNISITVLS
jgi:hypothetical protein